MTTKGDTASSKTQPYPHRIEGLVRLRDKAGREFWAAEVVGDGVRAGVDSVYGSWRVYERTDGAPLTLEPGVFLTGGYQDCHVRLQAELGRLVRAERTRDETAAKQAKAVKAAAPAANAA